MFKNLFRKNDKMQEIKIEPLKLEDTTSVLTSGI